MPSIIFKTLKMGRRKRGDSDGKQHVMIDAGIRLLARHDFEALSMARIAREAGCSVGSLYARFPDKDAYLYRVISTGLRSMENSAETDLNAMGRGALPPIGLVRLVVDHTVAKMASPRGAGIIRATIKLATIRPLAMKLFEEYRSAVSDKAVAMLATKGAKAPSAGEVRLAMQIIFATVTDAVVQVKPGPMVAGSDRMKAALTNITLGYLGISKAGGWAGNEAEGEDQPAEDDVVEDPSDAGEAVFDLDLRVMRRPKVPLFPGPAKRKAKSASNTAPVRVLVQTPAKVPKAKETAEPPPRPSRKHRFI